MLGKPSVRGLNPRPTGRSERKGDHGGQIFETKVAYEEHTGDNGVSTAHKNVASFVDEVKRSEECARLRIPTGHTLDTDNACKAFVEDFLGPNGICWPFDRKDAPRGCITWFVDEAEKNAGTVDTLGYCARRLRLEAAIAAVCDKDAFVHEQFSSWAQVVGECTENTHMKF